MKKLLLVVGILLGVQVQVLAQEAKPVISVAAKTSKEAYSQYESIDLIITIKNKTDQSVQIFNPAYNGVSALRLVNAESVEQRSQKVAAARQPVRKLWTLKPKEERQYTYANLRWFSSNGGREFAGAQSPLKPSVYHVLITLQMPPPYLPADQVSKEVWKGRIVGNLVRFKVFQPGKKLLTCSHCAEDWERESDNQE